MQKISSYLYSNRIVVNLDLATSPLEWRIVYQRKIKIYKGVDNVIELDIKNSEQKRINVSDKILKCVLMDTFGQEIYTADVEHSSTPGLATFIIPETSVAVLTPQFLRYTVYILNEDDTKTPVYGDTQFGVTGMMDLIGTAVPQTLTTQVIKTFNDINSTTTTVQTFYSEAAYINPPNDIVANPEIVLDFYATGLEGEIKVQVTPAVVVSTATEWTTIETFNVTTATSLVSKTYGAVNNYTNELEWLRITYTRTLNNTGKLDKVLVRV